MNQSKLEARENECKRVAIGFGLTSDWMKKWHKPVFNGNQLLFDTQMKTALWFNHNSINFHK